MFWTEKNGQVILFITVIPKASKNEIIGLREDNFGHSRLVIRLNAVPEKGKANKILIDFLAKKMKIAKTDLSLVSGETNRQKNIELALSLEEALEKVENLYP